MRPSFGAEIVLCDVELMDADIQEESAREAVCFSGRHMLQRATCPPVYVHEAGASWPRKTRMPMKQLAALTQASLLSPSCKVEREEIYR